MKDYNWKKLILIVLGCGILGGVIGGFSKSLQGSTATNLIALIESKFHYLYVIAAVIGVISLLCYAYFYTSMRKENFSDEENSFYERHEAAFSVAMSLSTICGILNFTAIGLTLSAGIGSPFWIITNVLLCFIGEVSYIALIKKVRPDLNADPLDTGFKDSLFDKMDECEKYKVGKSSFNTLAAMTPVYVGLFCLSYFACLIFEISPYICIPIGIIWLIQTILQTYYSNKADRTKSK